MEGKYFITQDQFEQIEHFKRLFDVESECIKDLCSTERSDINYGFELGKLYSSMRDNLIDIMDLCFEIRDQKIPDEEIIENKLPEDLVVSIE